MAEYLPSTTDWVREQVELYEGSGVRRERRYAIPGCPSSS